AARSWFGCSANDLDAASATRLAVALPNPFLRSPKARSRELDRKAARLVRALRRAGLLPDDVAARVGRELGVPPPPSSTIPPPAAPPGPPLPEGAAVDVDAETPSGE